MKKILLAFDGLHFSNGAFEFARILNEKKRIFLTAVFLPEVEFELLSEYSEVAIIGNLPIPLIERKDKVHLLKSIEKFKRLCELNLIEFTIHDDIKEYGLGELKKETTFADLLILGSETFFKNLGNDEPNEYLEDALHQAECPVIIVPEKFKFPQTNILAYDGSNSSVYAIKQFAYLFPDLTHNPTVLIYMDLEKGKEFPEAINIEELVGRHFADLTLFKFDDNPKTYFNSWLKERKSAILVAGSYGRSGFSRLLHKSFISDVIADHQIPVFTSHHK